MEKHIKDYSSKLANKNIDGFFIDNADIYYISKNKKVYESIIEILKMIKKHNLPIIINGIDIFLKDALKKNNINGLINAVNQETVFTRIDFNKRKFFKQKRNITNEYLKYLSKLKKIGIDIYLTEYTTDYYLVSKIKKYCKKHKYKVYVSDSIELK
ncbi:hypothetical protein [Caviibacter abscessus]|uniref:hypothetical protein n=1 Tax=Caviibacter abscessus TaxID=1766719 RepID=UPI000829FAD4|nr:hypothetical protein [Caviibacter abscessus]